MEQQQSITSLILSILCFGRPAPAYTAGYVGWGTPGLFSQLNSVADELLIHVYRGERPMNAARDFYASTRLLAYGNISLAAHFKAWSCEAAPPPDVRHDPQLWALPALLAAPRYSVASRLLHLMYQPTGVATPASERRYSLAVHCRRGDKLTEARNSEVISIWNEDKVVAASARAIDAAATRSSSSSSSSKTGGGVGNGDNDNDGSDSSVIAKVAAAARAAPEGLRPAILLASDDNAFAARVEARLRSELSVDVNRHVNMHDHGSTAPADACDEGCIAPLQQLAADFAKASTLMLSSKSNMGSFMVTWCGT